MKVSRVCASVAMGNTSLAHFIAQLLMKPLVCAPAGGCAMMKFAKAPGVFTRAADMALSTALVSQ